MENFTDNYERAYILFPSLDNNVFDDYRLEEIVDLCKSAGADVVRYCVQKIKVISPSTFMGLGKLEEIKDDVIQNADLIVFDGALSPAQSRNISDIFDGIKVIDRTGLILDIFAINANTREGKLQVELAQLKYLYPRLIGQGTRLSRLGGGIGTRGPGETQLEADRRHIRQRIVNIEREIAEISERRKLQKDRRTKNSVKTIALTGYTNAGKSSLLNALSGSNVLVQDKLFATLDPSARKIALDDISIILIDTVGFIRDIPTDLIEAFKSTLESAVNADIVLNVCDATGDYLNQLEVTEKTLSELNCTAPIIKVFNKADKITDFTDYPKSAIFVSALTGLGLDKLKNKLKETLQDSYLKCKISLPFDKISLFFSLTKYAESYEISYTDDGAVADLTIKKINLNKFSTLM